MARIMAVPEPAPIDNSLTPNSGFETLASDIQMKA